MARWHPVSGERKLCQARMPSKVRPSESSRMSATCQSPCGSRSRHRSISVGDESIPVTFIPRASSEAAMGSPEPQPRSQHAGAFRQSPGETVNPRFFEQLFRTLAIEGVRVTLVEADDMVRLAHGSIEAPPGRPQRSRPHGHCPRVPACGHGQGRPRSAGSRRLKGSSGGWRAASIRWK